MATDDEIREAARQYVRKVTGFASPSSRHQDAFDEAVDLITAASKQALERISSGLRAST